MRTRAERRAIAVAALAALAMLTVSCDGREHGTGSGGEGAGDARARPSAAAPDSAEGHEDHDEGRAPQDRDEDEDRHEGHVTVRDLRPMALQDGWSYVSCDAVDARFRVEPYNAAARWKAVALDYDPGDRQEYTDGNIARGVTLEPSSGTLEPGRTVTVRVSGRYESSRPDFWIIVQAPDPKWTARVSLPFRCR